jgi:acyl dehydratase
MEGRYYEDIQIGERHITPERTITETDIVNFVALAGLTEPMFRSVEYAKKHSMFKARIVPAFLSLSISAGLCQEIPLLRGTFLAFLGADELRIKKPLLCNDTIHVELEIVEKKTTQNPQRGIVKTRFGIMNQSHEEVIHYYAAAMVKRRQQEG